MADQTLKRASSLGLLALRRATTGRAGRFLCPALLLLWGGRLDALPPVREGDLVFQTSRSSQSLAVQKATASPYSHMGAVLFLGNRPQVFEAVSRVRYTPLEAWIGRGVGGKVVVKRLREAPEGLSESQVVKLRRVARSFEGKPYDLTFEWSDARIYCSELVWKLYQRALGVEIGELQTLGSFHFEDPVVRRKLRERYGDGVPWEEPVISPSSMFHSPRLMEVR